MNNDFHIKLAIDSHFQQTVFSPKFVSDAQSAGIVTVADNDLNNWEKEFHGLNAPHTYRGIFTLQLTQRYLQEYGLNSESINTEVAGIIATLTEVLKQACIKQTLEFEKILNAFRLHVACVYCQVHEKKFHFTFPVSEKSESIIDEWQKMMKILSDVSKENEETIKWIDSIPRQKNNMCFLIYDVSTPNWNLIDRLRESTLKLSQSYRNDINDPRIRKPYVVFNEDNYNQYTYFDKQWSLRMGSTEITLPQPNDVAMYVALADKNLEKAEKFLNEEYEKREEKLHMPLLRTDEYLNYYDYFESIIAAVTFSFTSIEALANICIPKDFQYTKEKEKKIQGKHEIERSTELRRKFTVMLREILKTPDPATQPWWHRFGKLEELRDEIIHTKQQASEKRYSDFLNRDVLSYIKVNKEIIQFYAHYINLNYRTLLFDVPYDFGADEVTPSFMSDEEFKNYYILLHNPWRPPKKDDENDDNKL